MAKLTYLIREKAITKFVGDWKFFMDIKENGKINENIPFHKMKMEKK